MFAHGSSMHQKCSDYALTNLLFGLCRFVWVINLIVTFLSPYSRAPTRPSTPKMLRTKEHYLNSSFFLCVHLGFTFESIKELGSMLVINFLLLIIIFFKNLLVCLFLSNLFFHLISRIWASKYLGLQNTIDLFFCCICQNLIFNIYL